MKVVRTSFPKVHGEAPEAKRLRYEDWVVQTHHAAIDAQYAQTGKVDASHTDPEYAAVMYQPGRTPAVSRPSKSLAVAARCWQCVGGDDDEADAVQGWSRVTNCAAKHCALWSVRPYQAADVKMPAVRRTDIVLKDSGVHPLDHGAKAVAHPGNRSLAVKGYCHQCCGGRPEMAVMREVALCRVGNCALWRVRPGQAASAASPTDGSSV